jgi:opacity protein-like surface antigen
MKPRRSDIRVIVLAVILSVSVPPALSAASDETCGGNFGCDTVPLIQITPFVVLDSHRDSRIGGAVAVRWKPRLSIEGETDYGEDILTTTAGLVWRTVSLGRLALYLAGGGGLQRREFSSPVASSGAISHSRHRFVTSVGGGADVAINSTWAVRGDIRWFNDDWRLASGVTLNFDR